MNTLRIMGGSSKANDTEREKNASDESLLLVEIAIEAKQQFANRRDKDRLVKSTLDIAREMIDQRPAVTEFIGEIAIASSRAQRNRLYAMSGD